MATPQKPGVVKLAVGLLAVSFVLSLVRAFTYQWPPPWWGPPWMTTCIGALAGGAVASLILAIASGREWAFIVSGVPFLLGLPRWLAYALSTRATGTRDFTLLTAIIASEGVALMMLFGPAAKAWFAEAKRARE